MSSHSQKRDLLEKKRDLKDAQREAKNRVCRGPRYPGNPEDYNYVIQEYCRPRDRARKDSQMPRRVTSTGKEKETYPSMPLKGMTDQKRYRLMTSVNQEIEEIEKIIDAHGEEYVDKTPKNPQFTLLVTPSVFQLMIDPDMRNAHPDPSKRYTKALMMVKKRLKNASELFPINASDIPRYMVMQMVLDHLNAIKTIYEKVV